MKIGLTNYWHEHSRDGVFDMMINDMMINIELPVFEYFLPPPESYKQCEEFDVSPAVQDALLKKEYKEIIQDESLFWQAFCLSYCASVGNSFQSEDDPSFFLKLSDDKKKLTCKGYRPVIQSVKSIAEQFRLFSMNLVSGRDEVVKVLYKEIASHVHFRVEGGEDCIFKNWLSDRSIKIHKTWFNDYVLPNIPFLFDSIGLACTQGQQSSEVFRENYEDRNGSNLKLVDLDVLTITIPDFQQYPIPPLIFPDREKSKLLDFFQSQYKTKKDGDIELQTKGGGVLKCHTAVISAYGGVFREMLDAGMKESQSKIINLDHFSEKTVMACLDFLYFGKQGLLYASVIENQVDLLELFSMAHTYQIEDLITYCGNLITRCYGQDSKECIKSMADLYSNRHLQDFYTYLCAMNSHSADSGMLAV
ncbi:BTB/POZ domain-containing protein [Endozoicomonas sp. SCSIO W0465]|uniref:BTB/POZ domain-containing protein n=1 Tax=Endozoicomonas sp. SCSIO W0465 TaxID=2918516 RepID=UPI0020763B84|nr:BTB/POZ domain-containing protein [Endozoicomonas sp. SCSIO W0465]USE35017.1 BTB/POZ domain-containing protein [Endozoicomonas sp. SCSIO W0465]